MANTIKVKHGNSAPQSSNLQANELGFDTSENLLYIGTNGSPKVINPLYVSENEPTNAPNESWWIDTTGNAWLEASNILPIDMGGTGTDDLLNLLYPVGAIYISVVDSSPASRLGGVWTRIEEKFLYGASDLYAVNSQGGRSTVTLTTNELPSHTHTGSAASEGVHTHTATTSSNGDHYHAGPSGRWFVYHYSSYQSGGAASGNWGSGGYSWYGDETASAGSHTHTLTTSSDGSHTHTVTVATTGSGNSFSIMPPYLSVYMWQRTE